jgi:hypothetical protein
LVWFEETPRILAEARFESYRKCRFGRGSWGLYRGKIASFRKYSVVYEAYRRHIPLTVHVELERILSPNILNMTRPHGVEKSHLDFRILANAVKSLNSGGVVR